jgi:hypothetical protein
MFSYMGSFPRVCVVYKFCTAGGNIHCDSPPCDENGTGRLGRIQRIELQADLCFTPLFIPMHKKRRRNS